MLPKMAIRRCCLLHLMAALLEDKEGVVLPVLEKIGAPVQQLLATVNGCHQQAAQGAGRERSSRAWAIGPDEDSGLSV